MSSRHHDSFPKLSSHLLKTVCNDPRHDTVKRCTELVNQPNCLFLVIYQLSQPVAIFLAVTQLLKPPQKEKGVIQTAQAQNFDCFFNVFADAFYESFFRINLQIFKTDCLT